jgi:hypothetical protein
MTVPQQHGLNLPDGCGMCGCPQFEIVRQYKTRGFINAIWKCTVCLAMNRTQTPNEYMKKKTAEEGKKRDTGRSGSSPKKKRNWW